jgi:hypothetical protein
VGIACRRLQPCAGIGDAVEMIAHGPSENYATFPSLLAEISRKSGQLFSKARGTVADSSA